MSEPREPIELQGLTQEERRFWRLIEERKPNQDGTEDVILACGHITTFIIPLPPARLYAQCVQCLHAWLKSPQMQSQNE